MPNGPKSRRRALVVLIAMLALAPFAAPAHAQSWPTRPVRLVVPFAPGGATDVTARIISDPLTRVWGETVVVENKPGAGTNLGNEAVAKSTPDGYTMLLASASLTTGRNLYKSLPYEISDLAPVSLVCQFPLLVLAPPKSPAKTLAEFVALARANPAKFSYATPGLGTTPHLAGELLKQMAGIDMTHVPYRGDAPALTDTMAGRVDLQIGGSSMLEQVRSGQVRALAVTTIQRSPLVPELAAVSETVPGYDVPTWYALFVAAKTPPDIIAKMNRDVGRVLAEPAIKARFAQISMVAGGSTPEALAALVDSDIKKWGAVIKAANITLDP
ncbi:MAG: tripartite tricarboxylate transporter substrate binding protein [Alphaproteobacteria bacterium]|nr:tripartite tricarboxylate transporter substrate binding protein [Alphaproteobacteria bacterium]